MNTLSDTYLYYLKNVPLVDCFLVDYNDIKIDVLVWKRSYDAPESSCLDGDYYVYLVATKSAISSFENVSCQKIVKEFYLDIPDRDFLLEVVKCAVEFN